MRYIRSVKSSVKRMVLRAVITELDHRILSLSSARKHRHVDCKRYGKCLDKAISKNWKSFSCAKCPVYKNFLKEAEYYSPETDVLIGSEVYYEEGFV